MRNKKLIPFGVIEKVVAGEPEAIAWYCGTMPDVSSTCLPIGGILTMIFKTV